MAMTPVYPQTCTLDWPMTPVYPETRPGSANLKALAHRQGQVSWLASPPAPILVEMSPVICAACQGMLLVTDACREAFVPVIAAVHARWN